ncbi:cation transporter [Pseudonocardia sp. NPDC049154]|uniref:heavy-metal-associated domain-containing protein n=1 Tax=Pseudonocardia sp. NPDC049154 TaxID=3155501 RepID=UPI0033D81774
MSVETPFRTTVTVVGMTCGHCTSSVQEEVGEVAGVRSVEVDLASGAVTVTADREIGRTEIEAAVVEAGYSLA